MTLEDLSSATARQNEKRMTEDVSKTARVAHPPRMAPPVSSRHSLAPADEDLGPKEANVLENTVGQLVSARVTDAEPSAPKSSALQRSQMTERDHVRQIMSSLEAVYQTFYSQTTPRERALVRLATAPPGRPHLTSLYSNPGLTLLIMTTVSFMVGILLSPKSQAVAPRFRGVSTSCQNAIDRMLRFR